MRKKITEKDVANKWEPVLNKMGITGPNPNWLSDYANKHMEAESGINVYNQTMPSSLSSVEFPSLLPMAMKVSAQTIGLDLVSVKPMSGFADEKLLEKAKKKVTAVNRDRQIEEILDDKEYVPLKIEETEEYKQYHSSPKGNLFYLDYKYGNTASNKNTP